MADKKEAIMATVADRNARLREIAKEEAREVSEKDFAAKNKNFVQISRKVMPAIGRLVIASPSAASLLLAMAERMGYQNTLIFDSECAQEWTGASKATIYRSLQILADGQWIKVERVGSQTTYHVNADVFWAAAKNLKFKSFRAKVPAGVVKGPSKPSIKTDRKVVPVYTAKRLDLKTAA